MATQDQTLLLTLAKVLVATAWADGELTNDEINSMKRDLLTRIPNLSAQEWASVAIYMDSPVDDGERAMLVEQLRGQIRTPENKQLVYQALDDLVAADGQIGDQERRALDQVKAALESGNIAGVGFVSRLFKGRSASAAPLAPIPSRELYLDDFVKNRVYYAMRRRLDRGEGPLNLPDNLLRKLSLAGGLLAKVARTNPETTDGELAAMRAALQQHWQLDADQAGFVVDVATAQLPSDLDSFRLADEFASDSDYDERGQLVDALFAVAAADGAVSNDEVEEIRVMSDSLVLARERFIEAKLKAST